VINSLLFRFYSDTISINNINDIILYKKGDIVVLLQEFLETNHIEIPSWVSDEMKNIELELDGDYEMIVENTYHHENQNDKQMEDLIVTGHFKNKELFRLTLTPNHRIYEEPLAVFQFGTTTGFGGRPLLIQWDVTGKEKNILN